MKKTIIDIIVVTLSTLLIGLSFNIFFLSFEMVISGSSGISIVLNHLFGINPSMFIFAAQICALISGLILLGPKFITKSIYGTFLYPFAIEITAFTKELIIGYNLPKEDFLIFIIIGAAISGFAYGQVFKRGYTTGGSDILLQIMHKYLGITVGGSNLIFSTTIILMGGAFLGFEKVLYAVLIIFIQSKMQDFILLGNYSNKLVIINSKHREKLKDDINNKLNLQLTQFNAKGGFLNHKNDLLMCLVNNTNYYRLKETILKTDPDAFIVVTHAYEYNMDN